MLHTLPQLAELRRFSSRQKKAALVALLAKHSLDVAQALAAWVCVRRAQKARLRPKWGRRQGPMGPKRQPLDWDEYMGRPHMTDQRFRRLFRMPRPAFDGLVKILDQYWEENKKQKQKRPGGSGRPVELSTSIQLAMTLRYLAGGAALDICEMYNVWDSHFYASLKRTIEAIYYATPDWPLLEALQSSTEADLEALSEGFRRRSHRNMRGAIGAIDGLLIPIRAPHGEANVKTYHCRKGFYAVNVQGICDADYRITYASIARAPGATHDSYAWSLDPLHNRLHGDDSPIAQMLKRRGYYLIGDDAYAASHTMVVPWPGKYPADSPQVAYNYWHSSARVAIEQTFGMLVRKFLVLKRPYEGSLRRTPRSAGIYMLIGACSKLVCPSCSLPRARARRPPHPPTRPRRAAQLLHRAPPCGGARHELRRRAGSEGFPAASHT